MNVLGIIPLQGMDV